MGFLVLLPTLIAFDMGWNKIYKCANFFGMAVSFIIAGLIGYMWAWLIDSIGLVNLMYMAGGLANETCQMAAQTQFKCTLRQV
jgi:hypothetical protein